MWSIGGKEEQHNFQHDSTSDLQRFALFPIITLVFVSLQCKDIFYILKGSLKTKTMTKTHMHQRPVWLPKPAMFTILLKEEFAHPALHKQALFLSLNVLETDFEKGRSRKQMHFQF